MKNKYSDEILDLTGVPCPQNSARALLKLAGMDPGKILKVIIDDGEPIENVPSSLEEEGYKITKTIQVKEGFWHLYINS
jgi:TusA-related sulfurtransferase